VARGARRPRWDALQVLSHRTRGTGPIPRLGDIGGRDKMRGPRGIGLSLVKGAALGRISSSRTAGLEILRLLGVWTEGHSPGGHGDERVSVVFVAATSSPSRGVGGDPRFLPGSGSSASNSAPIGKACPRGAPAIDQSHHGWWRCPPNQAADIRPSEPVEAAGPKLPLRRRWPMSTP